MSLHIDSNAEAHAATQTTRNESFKEKKKSFSLISFITNLFLKIFSSPMNFCGQFHWNVKYQKPTEKSTNSDVKAPSMPQASKAESASSAFAAMCSSIDQDISDDYSTGSSISINEDEFKEIFEIFEKNKGIKSSQEEIIRCNDKGEKLARPLMKTTDGKIIILFTKHKTAKDRIVGKGSDNVIKYAYNLNDRTTQVVGVHKPRNPETTPDKLLHPITLMRKLGESNVPKVEGCVIDQNSVKSPTGLKRYTVMQWYNEGSLDRLNNQMSFQMKHSVSLQMLEILARFEELGIVHGDLKSQNFVYKFQNSSLCVRAIDLDRSFQLNENSPNKKIGTIIYSAPEVLSNSQMQSLKADVYSMGLYLLNLWGYCNFSEQLTQIKNKLSADTKSQILGLLPDHKRPFILKNEKKTNDFLFLALIVCITGWNKITKTDDKLAELLFNAVDPNPENRPTAKEFLEKYKQLTKDNSQFQMSNGMVIMQQQQLLKQRISPKINLNEMVIKAAFEKFFPRKKLAAELQ